MTFADVYKLFDKDYFEERGIDRAESTRNGYRSSFNQCKPLHNRVFSSLTKAELQEQLDSINLGYSSLQNVKNLFSQMYRFAIGNGMGVDTNLGTYVVIKKKNEVEMGEPFTEKDIALLWENKDNINVKVILIMIYSGLRITEVLEASEIDMELGAFVGGVKTTRGKERIVPFHSSIIGFIPELVEFRKNNYAKKFRYNFNVTLTKLGLIYSGDKKHTPHDCRHTFSWLADKYKMDDLSKHLMMGHSLGGDIEKSVYGHRTFEELKNEIEKIVANNN